MVIVIAVIAILATALIPTFGKLIDSANETKYMQQARQAYNDYMLQDSANLEATYFIETDGDYYLVKAGKLDTEKTYAESALCGQKVLNRTTLTLGDAKGTCTGATGATECDVCGGNVESTTTE